ncbi:hypothetical protein IFM89_031933 [Coptis chinensis]|uniref:Pentatricopeptide repeat-containing protein n=1 Tax=Coptis chinensis TaxID=261450 RepID=A0A835ISE2_9MAGN|nr:hypothetical protein IFM89_031933 [Coptis chinensis]
MVNKDSVSWNIMIHGCLDSGADKEGLCMFVKARGEVFEPNVSTLVLVLQACRNLRAIYEGLGIHGLMADISVHNSLLGFHSLVHNERYWEALSLFPSMAEAGFEADAVTIVSLLQIFENLASPSILG